MDLTQLLNIYADMIIYRSVFSSFTSSKQTKKLINGDSPNLRVDASSLNSLFEAELILFYRQPLPQFVRLFQ
ncbi:hypothetical protein Nepgr_001951 [Nepenthes gracilis]|uniref:Uncharacterized protein n=1 Tax=Nepenthes gracilis TaxID=150966 RepID=A0AAD3P9D6_NEPGR|nr:hypothetical protein Nepgr_001951 [Nepenthes gracilis]